MSTLPPPSALFPSSPADPGRSTAMILVFRRARAPEPRDYPAAHSMDSIWYAVDANGAVAVLNSGSSGPVPKSATSREHGFVPRLVRILGGECDDDDFDLSEELEHLARLGIFAYDCPTWEMDFIDTYVRVGAPKKPLHMDQLPPTLRKNVAKCPLPSVDFAKAEELQVVGLAACDLHWDEAVGYFAVGHKEVRPIPGKEKEYAAALPRLRKENRKFQFADVGAAAGKQPPPVPRKPEEP